MSNRRFLTAHWRYLAMVNYEVDPAVLAPYLPQGVELDTWGGRTYASLVGFLFLNTRLLGAGIPFHRDFEEVNLRFYVRRQGPEGWRRGVTFVKEIVPRWAIAAVARGAYGERYAAMPMRHRIELEDGPESSGALHPGSRVEYTWRFAGEWNRISVQVQGEPGPAAPGSEEEFITEHYWGYVAQREGGAVEYRVEHPSWRVWQAGQAEVICNIAAIYGPQFQAPLSSQPTSAFVAEGSDVTVYWGTRLDE